MPDANVNDQTDSTAVLTDVLDNLLDNLDGDQASVDDVISAFEHRGFGALITAIGLVAAAPVIGAIPGMSILTGTLILLIAGQFIVGRNHPWIPSSLRNRSMNRSTLEKGIEKARPYTKWMDNYIYPRMNWLVRGPLQRRLIASVVCGLALTMYPLALIPWGVQPPATAIVFFGVAMMGRDGLFAALGYLLVALTAYFIYLFAGPIASWFSTVVGYF